MEKPWLLNIKEIEEKLKTSLSFGLTDHEALKRLGQFGQNEIVKKKKKHPIFLFFAQFENFIIWVLIVAALIAGFMKEWIDTIAIIGIVILNSVLGFIQEFKAEKALEALKKLFSHFTKVLREGEIKKVPSQSLVPGDVIEIEAGDSIPADCRVAWHTSNFAVQEASLTGESTPVMKTSIPLDEAEIILDSRANMVYMGTNVVSGRARCIVVATGMETEIGKIAQMIEHASTEKTPLQKRLNSFGKILVYVCLVLVGIIFLLELFRGGKLVDVFLTAVSLAVAAIPEGLPAVVTIALALGVQRMARRNVLIRKLPSVETLGCTTTICSDKTGTLTKNEMTVKKIYADGKVFTITGTGYAPEGNFLLDGVQTEVENYPGLDKALDCAILCNSARLIKIDNLWTITGDPTEGALLTVAAKAGKFKNDFEDKYELVDEIPFDSERKRMTVILNDGKNHIAFIKGAPEVLINLCSYIFENGKVKPIDDNTRYKILTIMDLFARQGLRVLATGFKELEKNIEISEEKVEKNIIFTGLFAMIDPPREEAKIAIEKCKKAGIKIKVITGDHRSSAIAVAKELGIIHNEKDVVSAEQIDLIDDKNMDDLVRDTKVFARVSPHHKLKIVRVLKRQNEIVAMTGDGVNDAPALKEADIGIAMGITGTDVTKEVSDMVITDDNFASIVAAVEEGRGIYENIRKFIHYLLSCNAGEIMVMFFASLLGMPVPLLPVQILWINMITDGLPALALGVDPVDPSTMENPPRKPDEPIINLNTAGFLLFQGALISICTLSVFWYVLFVTKAGIVKARTMAFFVLAASQLFHSFNLRSQIRSIFELGFSSNMKLVYSVLFSLVLQVIILYIPVAQVIFRTTAISGADFIIVIIVSSLPLLIMEVVKIFLRKGRQQWKKSLSSLR
ncbi:MAG: calcium-translocating P-type ATPase, SERCA-type [Candidatus Omnitrophica bacterium]|nr:calcium-translocating P-type ATPase, SERCA-type [Candidatus Omnitrophota bacterium]